MLPTSSSERPAEACVYEGVVRVLPDTIVSIDVVTGRVTRDRYWTWLDRMSDPGTDRLDKVAPHYAELLREAVRQRARGRTASHLSGGMDSTSVSLIALDLVPSGAIPHALSLIYERLPN